MSISKPIKISFVWDRENLLKAFESAYRYHYTHSARRYIGWLFVALAQFGVVAALKKGAFGLLLFSTILLLYWYVVKKALLKQRALKAFAHSPLKDRRISFEVSEAGIMQEGVMTPWERIEGVVPSGEGVMLYQEGREYYIPAGAFGGVEAMSRFKSLAREKGKLYD